METSGAVRGILYYWGTPRLEHEGNAITIPDLQMANETKMALDEMMDGYWHVVDEELGPRLKNALSGQHKAGVFPDDQQLSRDRTV